MRKYMMVFLLSCISVLATAQPKTELYDLVKMLVPDSSGYENVGDWAVGQSKQFPIKWKSDQLIMSDDTSINFYRQGTVDIKLNGRKLMQAGKPMPWNIMIKGPRMGYTSFSIISSPSKDLSPKYILDSVFGRRPYTAKLIKSCDAKTLSGFYYYQVKLPKEDDLYIKLSWLSVNGNTAIRIDGYDGWSRHSAKLDCPR